MTNNRISFVDNSSEIGRVWPRVQNDLNFMVRSGKAVTADFTAEAERRLQEVLGFKRVLLLQSCTDAITLSLASLGIGRGNEVILPAFSFVATLNAVKASGATPVFVDCSDQGNGFDLIALEKKLSSVDKIKAVVGVHLFGHPFAHEIFDLCHAKGIPLIEDSAQFFGKKNPYEKRGSFSCYSFDPTKSPFSFGTLGAAATNDSALSEKLHALRNQGFCNGEYLGRGWNSKPNEFQSLFLCRMLEKLRWVSEKREQLIGEYIQRCQSSNLRMIEPTLSPEFSTWNKIPIFLSDRESTIARLHSAGIESKVHYPYTLARLEKSDESFPNAEHLSGQLLSLPFTRALIPPQSTEFSQF